MLKQVQHDELFSASHPKTDRPTSALRATGRSVQSGANSKGRISPVDLAPYRKHRRILTASLVGTAVEFLRGTWPELQDVRFEIGAIPGFDATEEVPRWYLDRKNKRIVLFRLPIERLLPPGHDDAAHRRMAIESAVFRAAAEYVGREPWALGHDH